MENQLPLRPLACAGRAGEAKNKVKGFRPRGTRAMAAGNGGMQQKIISRVAVLLVALAIGLAGWDVVQVSAQTATPPSTTNLQSVLQSLGATAQQSTSGIPAPSAPVMVQPSVP